MFPDFKPRQMPLGATESLSSRIFTVPLFPELTDEEVIYVSEALRVL